MSKLHASKLRSRQRGSTLVESSLCFLGFMLLSFGLMELSWAVNAYNFCAEQAQDAAHFASLHGSHSPNPATADTIRAYVVAQNVGLNPQQLSVTTEWLPNNHSGSSVRVTVSYPVVPLIGAVVRQTLNVSSTAKFAITF